MWYHDIMATFIGTRRQGPIMSKPQYTKGQIGGGLRKAWKGYRIAKVQGDVKLMKEYATKIRTLQGQLGVPLAQFPNLTVKGHGLLVARHSYLRYSTILSGNIVN